jgi:catechol 2,3-dioxygenase-like lactoylglutathione lyase family enzyme
MIDHVSIGVRDLAGAARFYDAVLGAIGFTRLVDKADTVGFGKLYPEFWLNARPAMPAPGADPGAHVCLRGRDVAAIEGFHATALRLGGTSDGAPGPRPEYNPGYFAAFIRDPEGNRLEAVTFLPSEKVLLDG